MLDAMKRESRSGVRRSMQEILDYARIRWLNVPSKSIGARNLSHHLVPKYLRPVAEVTPGHGAEIPPNCSINKRSLAMTSTVSAVTPTVINNYEQYRERNSVSCITKKWLLANPADTKDISRPLLRHFCATKAGGVIPFQYQSGDVIHSASGQLNGKEELKQILLGTNNEEEEDVFVNLGDYIQIDEEPQSSRRMAHCQSAEEIKLNFSTLFPVASECFLRYFSIRASAPVNNATQFQRDLDGECKFLAPKDDSKIMKVN